MKKVIFFLLIAFNLQTLCLTAQEANNELGFDTPDSEPPCQVSILRDVLTNPCCVVVHPTTSNGESFTFNFGDESPIITSSQSVTHCYSMVSSTTLTVRNAARTCKTEYYLPIPCCPEITDLTHLFTPRGATCQYQRGLLGNGSDIPKTPNVYCCNYTFYAKLNSPMNNIAGITYRWRLGKYNILNNTTEYIYTQTSSQVEPFLADFRDYNNPGGHNNYVVEFSFQGFGCYKQMQKHFRLVSSFCGTTFNLMDITPPIDVSQQLNPSNEIRVYSTSEYLEINGEETENSTLILYNMLGQTIFQEKLNSNFSKVNIKHLNPGYYMVLLKNNNTILYSQKIKL